MIESTARTKSQFARIAAYFLGAYFALALVWVEGGSTLFGWRLRNAYPSGWPLCHFVYIRAQGTYEFNASAAVINAVICCLILISTIVVSYVWISAMLGKRKLALADFLKLITAVALLCAWASNERLLMDSTLGRFWVARSLLNPNFWLTHWTITSPSLEFALRITILIAIGCLIYCTISVIQHIVSVRIANARREPTPSDAERS